MSLINIVYTEAAYQRLRTGKLTAIFSAEKQGEVGDTFKASGRTFELSNVFQIPLNKAISKLYSKAGYKTKKECESAWNWKKYITDNSMLTVSGKMKRNAIPSIWVHFPVYAYDPLDDVPIASKILIKTCQEVATSINDKYVENKITVEQWKLKNQELVNEMYESIEKTRKLINEITDDANRNSAQKEKL